jgi:hypothetical protein
MHGVLRVPSAFTARGRRGRGGAHLRYEKSSREPSGRMNVKQLDRYTGCSPMTIACTPAAAGFARCKSQWGVSEWSCVAAAGGIPKHSQQRVSRC